MQLKLIKSEKEYQKSLQRIDELFHSKPNTSRKRPLNSGMIRKISSALEIPAEVLIQPYELLWSFN